MTRTPDEIKKGLSCCGLECADWTARCRDGCPYYPECDFGQVVVEDAISCIQQLQAENAQQARCIENLTGKLNATNDEVAKLQLERDEAVDDLKKAANATGECFGCKWYNGKICTSKDYKPICSSHDDKWQWRGVQKEDSNA